MFTHRHKKQSGFTLIELLMVTAIFAIIAIVSISSFAQYARFQEYQRTVAEIAQVFVSVQADAQVARFDENHGVYLGTSSITQFRGDQYDISDTNNIVYNFENIVISLALTAGVDEVRLEKVSGLPSATGNINIIGTNYEATTTFSISPAGVIEY